MAGSGRPRITRSGWAGLRPGVRVENARARPDDRGDDEIDAIRAGALDGRPAGARHVALAHVAVPWRERPAVQPDDEKGHDCAPVGVWAAGTGWLARIRPPGSTAAGRWSTARFHARLASSKRGSWGRTSLPASAAGGRFGGIFAWVTGMRSMIRIRRCARIGQVADHAG